MSICKKNNKGIKLLKFQTISFYRLFYFFSVFFFYSLFSQPTPLKVAYFFNGKSFYPDSVHSLLKTIKEKTSIQISESPLLFDDFADNRITKCQMIYINGNEYDWQMNQQQIENLRKYLKNGGFLFIDAGISADFLTNSAASRQNFPDWRTSKKITKAFQILFPENEFFSLPRDHLVFKTFYSGLPNTKKLPMTVKNFVQEFKWPQGTIATMGLKLKNRLAVAATAVMAMGWGKDSFGRWTGKISFRIREKITQNKETISALEKLQFESKYLTSREDGGFDFVYTESGDMPAWVQENNGEWKIFRYYSGNEINEYAHIFFERMGINFFLYGLTH